MKKRFLSIVLIGVLSASLCACSKSEPASNNDVTKTTEPTTSVELGQETKITKKMSDSEKITTAFDNTINADSFILMMGTDGYGDVSNYNQLSNIRKVYEFYKNKDSYLGVEAGSMKDFLSLIDVDHDDNIIDFYKFWGVPEDKLKEYKEQLQTSEAREYINSLKTYSLVGNTGFRNDLYYSPADSTFSKKLTSSDLIEDDGISELSTFYYFYNRDFNKVLDYSYEYEYGLPYRHFIRAVGMVFDNYPKSKDDLFFVADFNNEDGVYTFEAYALDFYRYYAANSDYQLPQEVNSGSNDTKIGVRYVLDGNYLTEMSAYLLEDNDTKYDDYYSYIFKKVNSIKEKESLACAYFKEIDEKYGPGNYKRAAEIFFSEFDDEDDERFKLGSSDENGVPIIIQYSGSSTSEYAYNGYIYEYVEDSRKDVGKNQLGYDTAKEVLDSMVNGTPLAEVPEWKQAYIDYIKEKYDGVYSLIYVDEDDIPELLWDYSENYTLFTYVDGRVIESNFANSDFYYLEKENIFRCGHWVAGLGSNDICKLENGVSSMIVSGEWSEYDANGNTLRDQDGNPLTEYTWDGSKVSKEEYDQQLEKAFDMSSAKTIDGSEKYTKEEIIQKIIDWAGSASTKQASSQNSDQDSGYILPDCDSRYYSQDELSALSDEQLKLARNEIYARHGYIFQPGNTKNYFDSKSWYRGTVSEVTDDMLNEFEIANRDLIILIENK